MSEIVEKLERRIVDAERAFTDALRADFTASLSLPIEEVMRRNNAALGELLDRPAAALPVDPDRLRAAFDRWYAERGADGLSERGTAYAAFLAGCSFGQSDGE